MDTFYVKDVLGNLVPAKYLMDGGAYVVDPSWGLHRSPPPLYNADGSASPDQNPNGYLIVPANYTLRQATDFGRYVKALAEAPDDSGPATALATMAQSLWTGSAQDLQRNYTDALGNPVANGAAVPAFQDAASFHLGAVTAVSGIPVDYALYGGGYLNARRAGQKVPVDTSGIYGNDPANANSIRSGFDYINNTPSATQPMRFNGNDTDSVAATPSPMTAQPDRADGDGALPVPPPQTQLTLQQVPAPPPSPFGVPIPPELLPLVPHFFPQGFDAATQSWPSTGILGDAGAQPSPVGSAGAGLDFTRGPMTSQQASAPPVPPIDVPIPEALKPLVPFFFP